MVSRPGDYWMDLGRPEQYLSSHRHILDGKMPMVLDHSNAPAGVIQPCFIGTGVEIADGAIVGPYAVIGNDCKIARGASVTDSILWDGVQVGESAHIDGAIIASNALIGENASIAAGAVIGHKAHVAAGQKLLGDARVAATT